MKHHSQEEILNALHVLAEVCDNSNGCDTCPIFLEKEGECVFTHHSPWDITIVDEQPKIWRAVV